MPPYILRYVLENRKWKKYLGLFARRKLAPTNFPTWNDYFLSKIWFNLRCKMPVYSPSLLPYSNYTKPNTRYLISNRSFRKLMPCDHFCFLLALFVTHLAAMQTNYIFPPKTFYRASNSSEKSHPKKDWVLWVFFSRYYWTINNCVCIDWWNNFQTAQLKLVWYDFVDLTFWIKQIETCDHSWHYANEKLEKIRENNNKPVFVYPRWW